MTLLAVLVLGLLGPPAASSALDVVYVTRHAQKAASWTGDGALRPLTTKGATCAAALAESVEEALGDASIGAVYSSETTRTLSTAAAVAMRSDATVVGDDASTQPDAVWFEALRDRHADDAAILFVGHSNTVDDLVLAVFPGAGDCFERVGLRSPEIPETQYGDLWRIDLRRLEASPVDCAALSRLPIEAADVDCSSPG